MSSCARTGLFHSCIPVRGSVGLNLRRILRPCCRHITAVRTSKGISPSNPAAKTYVGFGFPGSSSNRSVEEATVGMTQTIWSNKNYGALQLILQYSFVERNLWSPAPTQPPDAHTHLWYTDLRYVLP